MEEVKHRWDCIKRLTKVEGDGINNLRMYYVQRCRQLSRTVDLPKKNFGPSTMCSYCGTLWSKNNFQTRIIPGRNPSKSIKQVIESYSEDNKLKRLKATLIKKSLKNKMNKIIIKCLVCSKNTEISCTKPQRLKPKKEEKINVLVTQKKKKKKVKDKTAGLNVSNVQSLNVKEKIEVKQKVLNSETLKIKRSKEKQETPIQKIRKMNLSKLNSMLNSNEVQKSKKSLNNFLKELY